MKAQKNIALVAHDNRKKDLIACNRSTADFMISSPLMEQDYDPIVQDYSGYLRRELR